MSRRGGPPPSPVSRVRPPGGDHGSDGAVGLQSTEPDTGRARSPGKRRPWADGRRHRKGPAEPTPPARPPGKGAAETSRPPGRELHPGLRTPGAPANTRSNRPHPRPTRRTPPPRDPGEDSRPENLASESH